MNKKLLFALAAGILSFFSHAQFTKVDIKYWVGTGSDSTVLVVDFKDGTPDSSYAWGYLHDGTATGEDLLNAVTAADVNFTANIGGGFLSDIIYGNHEGIAGAPNYWGTFDGADFSSLDTNTGISTPLISGGWFGVSYSDWNPLTAPGEPIAAFPPQAFTLADAKIFVGSGSDTALLFIDFHDPNRPSSFAWGYLFNDSTTGGEMLDSIAAADPFLQVSMGSGFLNDIEYQSLQGIGGNPNYWGTWSATNIGNWQMNAGIGVVVKPGEFFGASYTDFAPALRPSIPAAAENSTGLAELSSTIDVNIYPQPASQTLFVEISKEHSATEAVIFSLSGQKLLSQKSNNGRFELDLSNLPSGAYLFQCGRISQKILIQ